MGQWDLECRCPNLRCDTIKSDCNIDFDLGFAITYTGKQVKVILGNEMGWDAEL